MNTITRYDMHHNPNQKRPEMWSAPDGDWVQFDDHAAAVAALQAEIDRLKEQVAIAKHCEDSWRENYWHLMGQFPETSVEQARLDGLREGWESASLPQWMGESFDTFLASRQENKG